MKDLDNLETIKDMDKSNMRGLLSSLPRQYRDACNLAEKFNLSGSFRQVKNIVISGMGGSAIGGDLIRSLFSEECPVPIVVNRNYSVPKFLDADTLFIAVSYSGDTEETISAFESAVERGAKVLSISSGGKLKDLSAGAGVAYFPIPEKGIQPRCAFGYLFVPMVVFLSRLGFIHDYISELDEAIELLYESAESFSPRVPVRDNYAKHLAMVLYNSLPVIYTGQSYFDVVAMRWKGQINENSKMMAFYNVIPEMNHNEIVGWGIPKDITRRCVVVMLTHDDEFLKIKRRMDVTKSLIAEEEAQVITVRAKGSSPLAKALYLIYLGDFVSYYLAILKGVDPTPVERISLLKARLKESDK